MKDRDLQKVHQRRPVLGGEDHDHGPNLRLDGSEPVPTWSKLPRTALAEMSVLLKYHLRGD